MILGNNDVRDLAIELLKAKSERDKQKKIGASDISDPCTKHLAHSLVVSDKADSKYWLSAVIGTAIHGLLEERADASQMKALSGALIENKIILGELDGYGTISSKPDLSLPVANHLIDWKTSDRTKSKKLQAFLDGLKYDARSEYTIQKYIAQTQLYAWGLNKSGNQIDRISLVFINRDGTYEPDVWSHTFEYSEEMAVALWTRLENLWTELQNGAHPNDYPGNDNCFRCAVGI